ncbi:MAG: hypothetical protein IMF07_04605 [Proteobacteria bacterium]|nr:hypothetical protein [Pseudomonadota bacterium]
MIESEEDFEEKDRDVIEDAELQLNEEYDKKDLKESRGFIKEHSYSGSKKTKHTIVKKGK